MVVKRVADPDFTLYQGDALEVLRALPDESVHCVVTSPPYFGLRDYGTGLWEGGDEDCDHTHSTGGPPGASIYMAAGNPESTRVALEDRARARASYKGRCGKCGAVRVDQQLGLEATPADFVARLVEIFREVRRVLRSDGTAWLNLGDTYASAPRGTAEDYSGTSGLTNPEYQEDAQVTIDKRRLGVKPKDLMLVPFHAAIALQADGWWVRQTNIWSKKNAMPESAEDRTTTAHEYVFQLNKSGSTTYWTHRDGRGTRTRPEPDYVWVDRATGDEYRLEHYVAYGDPDERLEDGRPRWRRLNLWAGRDYFYDGFAIREKATWERWGAQTSKKYVGDAAGSKAEMVQRRSLGEIADRFDTSTKNARSVWEINTVPFADAHFAVFPPKLPQRCILAGTSEHGVCAVCGAPWARVVEQGAAIADGAQQPRKHIEAQRRQGASGLVTSGEWHEPKQTGWQPTCGCGAATEPATVLDPFAGAGTTALVARELGRRSIAIELSPEYAALIESRLAQLSLFSLPYEGGSP